jgi:hypothetical protein
VENAELLWTPQRPESLATDDMTELELLIGEWNLCFFVVRDTSDKLKETQRSSVS